MPSVSLSFHRVDLPFVKELIGSPKFPISLYRHAMCQDPDRPSLESRHRRFFCIGFRCENDVAICINLYLRGCVIHFRKYGLPYGLSVSLCTLHLMVTHFDATLGMVGWLDLTQQGLSPCKKYRASWRSPAKSYRIINMVHLLHLFNLKVKY